MPNRQYKKFGDVVISRIYKIIYVYLGPYGGETNAIILTILKPTLFLTGNVGSMIHVADHVLLDAAEDYI